MSTLGSQWLRLRVGLPSLGLVLMAGGAVRAQETRSTLLGTVKDATGALVPGATVEITNSETNVTSTAITNNSGYYEVPYLLPAATRSRPAWRGSRNTCGRASRSRSTAASTST